MDCFADTQKILLVQWKDGVKMISDNKIYDTERLPKYIVHNISWNTPIGKQELIEFEFEALKE